MSLSHHSSAVYIASVPPSEFGNLSRQHLFGAITHFTSAAISTYSEHPFHTYPQKELSSKLDDHIFSLLLSPTSVADRTRLLLVSSPHAASNPF